MTLHEYPYTAMLERFRRDTAQHEMTVLHDDGLYRHLRFQAQYWRPPLLHVQKRSCYWFDLLTAPGSLTFQGDGDAFHFRRIEDMFEFFREPGGAAINPGYWSEKLVSGRDGVMVYQQEMLQKFVDEAVTEAVADAPETLAGLAAVVQSDVTDELCGDESIDRQAVSSFRYWANDDDQWAYPSKNPDFEFVDTYDVPMRDYDWWFLWACYGIVWGIAKYDAAKADSTKAVAA